MDQTTINLLVPGLVAITVFLFFAAGIILAKRGAIKDIPPENQYDTRLASIYSELRGLAITLEGLIVLLGVVAAVLLYGNAYLVNVTKPHSVSNASTEDRIHLVGELLNNSPFSNLIDEELR